MSILIVTRSQSKWNCCGGLPAWNCGFCWSNGLMIKCPNVWIAADDDDDGRLRLSGQMDWCLFGWMNKLVDAFVYLWIGRTPDSWLTDQLYTLNTSYMSVRPSVRPFDWCNIWHLLFCSFSSSKMAVGRSKNLRF